MNDARAKPVLVIHWDGMDQAKWSIPRVSKTTSKTFSGFDRRCLKVQGVWLHHYSLQFFVLDPRLNSGSSAICDCASRALEAMVVECRRRSILIGFFHYFHHPFWGTPILGNIHTVVDDTIPTYIGACNKPI